MVKLIAFENLGIDRDSEMWALDVAQDQKDYVASIHVILGRAYIFRELRPRIFWIFHDDTAVGMALYYDDPDKEAYDFSQIFIDRHHQQKGYGTAAARLVLEEMKKDGKYSKVTMCYVDGNEESRKLFGKLGFLEVSHPWDEIFMEASL